MLLRFTEQKSLVCLVEGENKFLVHYFENMLSRLSSPAKPKIELIILLLPNMIKTNILNPLREFNIKVAAKELVERLEFSQQAKIKTLKKYDLDLKNDLKNLELEIAKQYQEAYPGIGYSDPSQSLTSVQSLQDVINIKRKSKGDDNGGLCSSPDSDLITPPMSPSTGRKQFFSSPIEMELMDVEFFFPQPLYGLPCSLPGLVLVFLAFRKIDRNYLIIAIYLIGRRIKRFLKS